MATKLQLPISGFMNGDDAYEIFPKGHYAYAKNITLNGNRGNYRAETTLGNRLVSNPYLSNLGVNTCIGRHFDEINNRLFIFNYNSLNNHGIYIYNFSTNTWNILIQNSVNTDGDILGFNPNNPIHSIDILYGDVVSGDILTFIDSLGRPTKININRYLNNTYSFIKREYINVAKAPPQMIPKVVYENADIGTTTNNIQLVTTSVNTSQKLFFSSATDLVEFTNAPSSYFNSPSPYSYFYYTGTTPATVNLSVFLLFNYNTPNTFTVSVQHNLADISGSVQTFPAGSYQQGYAKNLTVTLNQNDSIRVSLYTNAPLVYNTQFLNVTTGSFTINQSVTTQIGTAILNNLTDKLFQFRIRYVYDDYEKSVLGAATNIPLPNLDPSSITQPDLTKNAKIAIYLPTGDIDVIKIEIATRITTNGSTSDWLLIDSLDKNTLSIPSNSVYKYLFYNNSTLLPIPLEEQLQLYDYVPISCGCQTSLNGNVLAYGDILEGYDLVHSNQSMNLILQNLPNQVNTYADLNGVLFFAQINGADSGQQGTQITFYFDGTGTNDTNGNPTSFDSPFISNNTVYASTKMAAGNLDLSVSFALNPSISTNINTLSSLLTSKGFVVTNTTPNTLTATYNSNITLFSSGVYLNIAALNGSLPIFSYGNRSSQYFGIQYFDEAGRTNGVTTNNGMKINFPLSSYNNTFNQFPMFAQINIFHRPPIWAKYYSIVRSNNLTYSKLLYWVSKSVTSDISILAGNQYAYIGIDNIFDYNNNIQATQGVVSYDYSVGDRVTIYGRFDANGTNYDYAPTIFDYPILGITTNPVINGIQKIGTFLKINYPTNDIGTLLNFSDNLNFQNYKIIIYNITQQIGKTQTPFFEFGKNFSIGNAGTSSAYHIGLDQNQSQDLTTPAQITIPMGDFFFRKRNVPIGNSYYLTLGSENFGNRYATANVNPPNGANVVTPQYTISNQTSLGSSLLANQEPTYSNGAFFQNTSPNDITIELKFTIPITVDNTTSFDCYIKQVKSDNSVIINTLSVSPQSLITNQTYNYAVDQQVKILAGAKAFLIFGNTNSIVNMRIVGSNLLLNVINNVTIPILDSSFSDIVSIKTNSNGRPTQIDINAKQTRNNTLLRWSRPRQIDTNINEMNKFYDLNYDEVSKQYGGIIRMDVDGQKLHIFQYRKCGVKGIYNKYIKNTNDSTQLIVTDTILTQNNIQYYVGDFGIGNQPTGLVKNGYVYYFPDPIKGYLCRLSQDGITPISEIYKQQVWAGNNISNYANNYPYQYGGYAKILGTFHYRKNKYMEYICVLQNGNGVNGSTISFNEVDNSFSSFYDYNPEQIISCNNTLVTFLNGQMWIHDSQVYNNFYGVQYSSSIKFIVNDGQNIKKDYVSIGYNANQIWQAPNMGDISTSIGAFSNLLVQDFEDSGEGMFYAALWGDGSQNGLIKAADVVDAPQTVDIILGGYLKGVWASINLSLNSSNFGYIQGVYCTVFNSPKN